jgi:hypothetical protein
MTNVLDWNSKAWCPPSFFFSCISQDLVDFDISTFVSQDIVTNPMNNQFQLMYIQAFFTPIMWTNLEKVEL